MPFIFLFIAIAVIVLMISYGWFTAAKAWADEYAERESERRFKQKMRNVKYHFTVRVRMVDGLKDGECEC